MNESTNKNSINYSLSGAEILKLLDNKCNLVQYSDLHSIKSIDDLLGVHKKCILLYHTSQDYGHWCCIYENNNTIFFFDSYGIVPDDELKFLPIGLKKELNSNHRYLTELLYNSGKPVEYNQYKLQKRTGEITTCGKWCVNRLRFPDISVNEYHDIFNKSSKYVENDKLICLLVQL